MPDLPYYKQSFSWGDPSSSWLTSLSFPTPTIASSTSLDFASLERSSTDDGPKSRSAEWHGSPSQLRLEYVDEIAFELLNTSEALSDTNSPNVGHDSKEMGMFHKSSPCSSLPFERGSCNTSSNPVIPTRSPRLKKLLLRPSSPANNRRSNNYRLHSHAPLKDNFPDFEANLALQPARLTEKVSSVPSLKCGRTNEKTSPSPLSDREPTTQPGDTGSIPTESSRPSTSPPQSRSVSLYPGNCSGFVSPEIQTFSPLAHPPHETDPLIRVSKAPFHWPSTSHCLDTSSTPPNGAFPATRFRTSRLKRFVSWISGKEPFIGEGRKSRERDGCKRKNGKIQSIHILPSTVYHIAGDPMKSPLTTNNLLPILQNESPILRKAKSQSDLRRQSFARNRTSSKTSYCDDGPQEVENEKGCWSMERLSSLERKGSSSSLPLGPMMHSPPLRTMMKKPSKEFTRLSRLPSPILTAPRPNSIDTTIDWKAHRECKIDKGAKKVTVQPEQPCMERSLHLPHPNYADEFPHSSRGLV